MHSFDPLHVPQRRNHNLGNIVPVLLGDAFLLLVVEHHDVEDELDFEKRRVLQGEKSQVLEESLSIIQTQETVPDDVEEFVVLGLIGLADDEQRALDHGVEVVHVLDLTKSLAAVGVAHVLDVLVEFLGESEDLELEMRKQSVFDDDVLGLLVVHY